MRKIFLIFLLILLCGYSYCFCQTRDEKMERTLEALKGTSSVSVYSGYDSNVQLAPQRKGDVFEEFRYSYNLSTPFGTGTKILLNYDLDYLNYNEVTDASNLLNHLRLSIQKKLKGFSLGTGYDFSFFYYPKDEDSDFLFHKGFVYLRNYISRTFYQQLLAEYGLKQHTDQKALSGSIFVLQEKERVDTRESIEYSLGSTYWPKLFLGLKTRFSFNDSNASYQNFYDYKSYAITPTIEYGLTDNLKLLSYFTYTRRNYTDRLVSGGTEKEKDNIYAAQVGLRYRLNKQNALSLFYTYRDNSTNEPLEKYTENVMSCSWQYNF